MGKAEEPLPGSGGPSHPLTECDWLWVWMGCCRLLCDTLGMYKAGGASQRASYDPGIVNGRLDEDPGGGPAGYSICRTSEEESIEAPRAGEFAC